MQTVFLIGNGFDVNCGMKTKYSDAYPEYINQKSESDVIKRFKDEISQKIENWGDFEIAMSEYAEMLDDEKAFIECISDFSLFLRDYLERQQDQFQLQIKESDCSKMISEEMRKSIGTFYDGISNNITYEMKTRNASRLDAIGVISFNYTSVFDKLFYSLYTNAPFKAPVVTHIHGGLDVPVLGMDNESQIHLKNGLSKSFKRSFLKPFFNREFDVNRINQAEDKIRKAYTICVYGMSLGESDLTWRNLLIEWMESSRNCHLFLYDYDCSMKKYTTIPNRMDIEDDAKAKILNKWGVDDVDALSDQFHIVCGKNIFNIGSIIKEYEKKKNTIAQGKKIVEEIVNDRKVAN